MPGILKDWSGPVPGPFPAALILALGLALSVGFAAHAVPNSVSRLVPSAKAVGQGTLKYAFFRIYEATLYAPSGDWRADRPFALEVQYHRGFDAKALARASSDLMERQGFADRERLGEWRLAMEGIFPDVESGTTLTAIRRANGSSAFFSGGKALGSVADSLFSKWFFGIWLGDDTAMPDLREGLLGLENGG